MLSGTMSLDLEFDLEGQMLGKRSWLCKMLREASYRLRQFRYTCYVLSGRHAVPHPLTLNLALNVKCQVKGHCCVSCPGRLVIVLDHFGIRADVIWLVYVIGWYGWYMIWYTSVDSRPPAGAELACPRPLRARLESPACAVLV